MTPRPRQQHEGKVKRPPVCPFWRQPTQFYNHYSTNMHSMHNYMSVLLSAPPRVACSAVQTAAAAHCVRHCVCQELCACLVGPAHTVSTPKSCSCCSLHCSATHGNPSGQRRTGAKPRNGHSGEEARQVVLPQGQAALSAHSLYDCRLLGMKYRTLWSLTQSFR